MEFTPILATIFFFIKIPNIVWHWFSKSNIRSFEDYGVSFFLHSRLVVWCNKVQGISLWILSLFGFKDKRSEMHCSIFSTIWNYKVSHYYGTPCSRNLDFAKLPHWKHVWELSKILTAHIISKIFKSIPSIHTQYLLAQSFIITL